MGNFPWHLPWVITAMERSIQLARKRDTIDLFTVNKETRPDIIKKNSVDNSNKLIG